MTISRSANCVLCDTKDFKANESDKIGETVVCEVRVGAGYDKTEYLFYQCRECGSLWRKCVDSGAGGGGSYISKLNCF